LLTHAVRHKRMSSMQEAPPGDPLWERGSEAISESRVTGEKN
jgi:hypothetical protein